MLPVESTPYSPIQKLDKNNLRSFKYNDDSYSAALQMTNNSLKVLLDLIKLCQIMKQ